MLPGAFTLIMISDHWSWTTGVGMVIDREWGNDHHLWSRWSPWKNWWVVEIKNSAIDPPLNFGSLNTVVDRRSDEQGVGGIMAQIEQRIRRGLMAFGAVYGEEKFKNPKRKEGFITVNPCILLKILIKNIWYLHNRPCGANRTPPKQGGGLMAEGGV